MLYISSYWDVCHLLMHGAMEELSQAQRHSHVIETETCHLELPDLFQGAHHLRARHASARKHLVKATMLFQAGMEAQISDFRDKDPTFPEIKKKDKNDFVMKWKAGLTNKGLSGFDHYATFYKKIRISIQHPELKERIEAINSLTFATVYKAFYSAWGCVADFAESIGEPHDQDSWGIMCSIHNIPASINPTEYPNLLALSSEWLSIYQAKLQVRVTGRPDAV